MSEYVIEWVLSRYAAAIVTVQKKRKYLNNAYAYTSSEFDLTIMMHLIVAQQGSSCRNDTWPLLTVYPSCGHPGDGCVK